MNRLARALIPLLPTLSSTLHHHSLAGTFLCLDKQKNILMRDTKEYRPENEQSERHVGLVLVPFQHVKSCLSLRGPELRVDQLDGVL